MTIALLGLGALAAAAGTRAAGFVFLGVAVVGALGSSLPALVTWIAATAAALIWAPGTPRRLALPVLGAAAALGAGSARNTTVVLGLWIIGTGAAVLTRGDGPGSDRWAQTLCLADLPVVAAVAWTAFDIGLEGWPQQLDPAAVVLLLIGAALRAPLASGPQDGSQASGLLIVRAQSAALLVIAIGAPAADDLLSTAAALAAVGFLVGGIVARSATRDVIQELALVALVSAAARSGWGPQGWEWGALAAGTLMHNLRLRLGDGAGGPLAGALYRGAGLGLPLLPVVLVGLEGAIRAGGWVGSVMMLGLAGGSAARASTPWVASPAPHQTPDRRAWAPGVATAGVALCAAAGLWAPALTVPEAAAGEPIGWPPGWAAVAVLVTGAAAAIARRRSADDPAASPAADSPRRWQPLALPELRVPARLAQPRLVLASTAVLGLAALAMWVVGVLRGFL